MRFHVMTLLPKVHLTHNERTNVVLSLYGRLAFPLKIFEM